MKGLFLWEYPVDSSGRIGISPRCLWEGEAAREDFRMWTVRTAVFQLLRRWACLSGVRVTCAVESEGEEDVVASQATVPCIEITFGHGEGMSEVEGAVHVGVGKGLEILGFVVGFSHKILMSFPNIFGPLLQ